MRGMFAVWIGGGAVRLAASVLLAVVGLSFQAAGDPFAEGLEAYARGDYSEAAAQFRQAAADRPAAGTFHNLGLSEWQSGYAGEAVLAWQRALWLAPGDRQTQAALRYARSRSRLPQPELTWYEVCSTWLPGALWTWIAMISLWGGLALAWLPGWLRWRRAESSQALATAAFALFILTLPALVGLQTRSRLAVIRSANTPLRLTPTAEAQTLTRLEAGETVRWVRGSGDYSLVRDANDIEGWVLDREMGRLAAKPSVR